MWVPRLAHALSRAPGRPRAAPPRPPEPPARGEPGRRPGLSQTKTRQDKTKLSQDKREGGGWGRAEGQVGGGAMPRHNNVIPNTHFRKHWHDCAAHKGGVRTWFNQPGRKVRRRTGASRALTQPSPTPSPTPPLLAEPTPVPLLTSVP